MKKSCLPISFFLCLLGLCCNSFAQTSNEGILHVTPGTEFSSIGDLENSETGLFLNDGEMYIYADFINWGFFDFMDADGKVSFLNLPKIKAYKELRKLQQIHAFGETYFSNVIFDNDFKPAPFLLSDTIRVEGFVDFRRGIVDGDSREGIFVFGEHAGYAGVSEDSHVDGPVGKVGDKQFTFPVGDQRYYRFAALSNPADPSEKYETTYFKKDSDKQYPHASVSKQAKLEEGPPKNGNRVEVINYINDSEYWRVVPISPSKESDLLLTLSWDERTTPQRLWVNPQAIHILRWDEQQELWIDEGGVVDEEARTVTTGISEYGIFTLGTVNLDHILPCEIAVYNAMTPNGDGVNDAFIISPENVACTGEISVKIYNRWGTKVFESDNYDMDGEFFNGYSQHHTTLGNSQLPTGTYFYTLEYTIQDPDYPVAFKKAGFLHLNSNKS